MLIQTHDIAELARISLTEDEHATFAKDIESILTFIDTIQTLTVAEDTVSHSIGMAPVGVLRVDTEVRRDGEFSPLQIVAQAPETGSGYVKVKKILNQ